MMGTLALTDYHVARTKAQEASEHDHNNHLFRGGHSQRAESLSSLILSTVGGNGRMIRAPDAPRQLILWCFYCTNLTTAM